MSSVPEIVFSISLGEKAFVYRWNVVLRGCLLCFLQVAPGSFVQLCGEYVFQSARKLIFSMAHPEGFHTHSTYRQKWNRGATLVRSVACWKPDKCAFWCLIAPSTIKWMTSLRSIINNTWLFGPWSLSTLPFWEARPISNRNFIAALDRRLHIKQQVSNCEVHMILYSINMAYFFREYLKMT